MANDPLTATPLAPTAGLLGTIVVLFTGVLALTQALPRPPAEPNSAAAAPSCALSPEGFFRGRFFGAVAVTADWSGAGLTCDGMPRPDGRGVRLYFAGQGPDGGRLAVLIGLDGQVDELTGGERQANVTVIDEITGRFFSTAGQQRCWATIASVARLPGARGQPAGSRIDGLAYCVGALASVGDRASLTLGELQFAGWVAAGGR